MSGATMAPADDRSPRALKSLRGVDLKNEKVGVALDVLGQSATVLIVLGRYVPGVRFAVNAGMGLTKYSYPKLQDHTPADGA